MALFQWVAAAKRQDLLRRLENTFDRLGLEIDADVSNVTCIYARDKYGINTPMSTLVTVLISSNNATKDEFLVEVRSSEPMLKRGTRCETVANQLKTVIPGHA